MVRRRLTGYFRHREDDHEHDETIRTPEEHARSHKVSYLSAIDIFQDMTSEEIAEIDRATRMSTSPRGQVIYSPGETGEVLFLLKQGQVQLYKLSSDGRKLVIASVGPQNFFGEMSLLGQDMSSVFAEATEDSTLCIMTRDDVERLVLSKPRVALRILEVIGLRLREAEARLEDVVFRSVPARVASLLLRLTDGSQRSEVQLSHQEVADVLGVYRETVTNALDRLKEQGAVDLGRRRITILKLDLLREIADQ